MVSSVGCCSVTSYSVPREDAKVPTQSVKKKWSFELICSVLNPRAVIYCHQRVRIRSLWLGIFTISVLLAKCDIISVNHL